MTDENLKTLLAKGFIPDNLPKLFTSNSFAATYSTYEPLLDGPIDSIPYKYDVFKKAYATRRWTLLNPHNFAHLAKVIKDNWDSLEAALEASKLSFTPIKFGDNETRNALRQLNKGAFQDAVFRASAGLSALLIADIVEHYDSTYTHAISWAIHGKEESKRRRKEMFSGSKAEREAANQYWRQMNGNIIDKALRDGDESQTHGIPTGPQTSRIVSEAILSTIDGELEQALRAKGIVFVGGRYVDDYELYFPSKLQADIGLQLLRDVLNKYCYKVNEEKTRIVANPPIQTERLWQRKLALAIPKPIAESDEDFGTTQDEVSFAAIKRLIKESVLLSKEHENPLIVRDLLKHQLKKYKCSDEDWPLYETFLLQLMMHYPNTAGAVLYIIKAHQNIPTERTISVLNRILSSDDTTIFDAIWALYGCLWFDVEISEVAVKRLIELNDPLLWLMLLNGKHNGKVDIDDSIFIGAWDACELRNEGWLFKYEAVRQGWLSDTDSIVANDEFFGKLLAENVTFYQIDKTQIGVDESDLEDEYEDIHNIDLDIEPDFDWLFDIETGR